MKKSEIKIEEGYVPGSIGRISELHATYYYKNWEFGLYFESKVAEELSEFLKRYHKHRDGFWVATFNGRVEGSIVIDGSHAKTSGAHLRWFILSEAIKGNGVGKRLISKAMDFCRLKEFRKVYLWTFEGLDAAKHLYEQAGFKRITQQCGTQWGTEVNEQCFELTFKNKI